ncbi:MAG TPA: hypothetical protein VK875_08725 [Euzebyales bacterium]|nr:hypothetical protein [Euzebyales bacterium]
MAGTGTPDGRAAGARPNRRRAPDTCLWYPRDHQPQYAGEAGADDQLDDQFVDLLDATMVESSPGAARVVTILEERGWSGWTRIERMPAHRLHT